MTLFEEISANAMRLGEEYSVFLGNVAYFLNGKSKIIFTYMY